MQGQVVSEDNNHDILYTKDKLKKANLSSDDLCYLYKKERHTVKHMLLKCSHMANFWIEFFSGLVATKHKGKQNPS